MVLFNYATRELTAKIVYYGPGLCGKTTNLEYIHKSLPEKSRGKMLSLATQTDRTLFFDFLPLDLGSIKGMKTRVQLYTVPGQVFYDATRKLVLKGADGVVFIADSQKEMMQSNLDSWENLRLNLIENNLDINSIPLVIQYNKRDLPNVLPVKDLNPKINVLKVPYFEAIALTGMGVQETFKGIAKVVMAALSRRYGKPEEAAPAKEEKLEKPKVEAAKASVSVPAPQVEPLELGDLEEVQELPQVDELEIGEEAALSLEPVEMPVRKPEAVPERKPSKSPKEEAPVRSESVSPRESVRPQVKPAPVVVPASVDSSETELIPDETLHLSKATVSSDLMNQDVPIEISIGRAGQDIKLNITIHLRIRVNND